MPALRTKQTSLVSVQLIQSDMLLTPIDHDPAWKNRFETLRMRLGEATGIRLSQIEHIGSTAVEGLTAKPIIDMQIGVTDLASFPLESVLAAGFDPAPEITEDKPFRDASGIGVNWRKKYARFDQGGRRIAHLHIRQIGAANYRFALLFRDYLQHDPEACHLYSEFKRAAARITQRSSSQGGTGDYLDLKDPFMQLIACRAEDWATVSGWYPNK